MCFGDSEAKAKESAENQQLALSNQLAATANSNEALVNPYYTNILQNGLPYIKSAMDYTSGDLATQYNQVKAAEKAKQAGFGATLPAGFANQTDQNLDESKAQNFDSNMMNLLQTNEAAKMAAAQGLNPLAYYGGAQSGFQATTNAPPVTNGWGNFLSGVVGAAGNAFKFNLGSSAGAGGG